MTGRTHDLAAFTALTTVFIISPLHPISLATLAASVGANFIGGLFPDLDNASSKFWKQIRGGSFFGRLLSPLLGGHRMITHSLLGFITTGFIVRQLLYSISHILIVDMNLVWFSFMIGFTSHLFTDAFTKEGIPLFFPLPINIGFPPFKSLRIKSGGYLEKSIIYPGLMFTTGYLLINHASKVLDFFRHYLS